MYSNQELYKLFDEFMRFGDWYPKPIPGFPFNLVDRFGNVYDLNGNKLTPYHYDDDSHYDMVYIIDEHGKKRIMGIHQLVAMTFNPAWFPGCVVHHIDENKYNNNDWNLECMSVSTHARTHNPNKYKDVIATCEICGREFVWTESRQRRYYEDLRYGFRRIITCSKSCSSYAGRMTQLGRNTIIKAE